MNTVLVRWKIVLQLAWPLVIANCFWNLQITIDRVFLGQFSTASLAASMAAAAIYWAPLALLQQTVAYVSTFVAQYFGADEPESMGPIFWQSLYISIGGGVLFLLFVPLAPWLINIIGHPESLQSLEVEYFTMLCFAALPTAIVAAASGFLTGLGRTVVILFINGLGLVVNVVFDYLLIFGNGGFPELGIKGAGIATVAGNTFAAIFALGLVFSKNNQTLYQIRSHWQWRWRLFLRFIKYALPSGMQWALEGLAFTIFLIYIGRLPNGEAALASSSIAVTLMLTSILPALGVGQAVSILVGQSLGRGDIKNAVRVSWDGGQIAALYIFIIAVTFVCIPEFYISWFENKENLELWQQVQEITPILLIYVAVFTLFDSMNCVFSFALKGAGDTQFVSLVALALPWPLMVIPTIITKNLSSGVYWAWGFASLFIIVQSLVFLHRFIQGKWHKMSVIN